MWETAPSLGVVPDSPGGVLEHQSLPESLSRNGKAPRGQSISDAAGQHGKRLCRGCSMGEDGEGVRGCVFTASQSFRQGICL